VRRRGGKILRNQTEPCSRIRESARGALTGTISEMAGSRAFERSYVRNLASAVNASR
jgi:hypothetical protein